MLPNFVVIGAPRSGTSWIHQNLMRHPEVFVPRIKEVHFFDKNYQRGIDYYESFFEGWNKQPAIGETTPAYLHGAYTDANVPLLIHQHLPDVKLIACLRNPTERAYSRYWNSKAKYEQNQGLSFEQKLANRPEFIAEGFYFDQLKCYFDLFPKEQILVTLFDDLCARPKLFMESIYRFLKVDPEFNAGLDGIQINAAAGKNHLAKSKVIWGASALLGYLGLESMKESMRKRNSVEVPTMNGQTRNQLVEIYRDQNQKLTALIGRDLTHWNCG